jgi:hypothetical protein
MGPCPVASNAQLTHQPDERFQSAAISSDAEAD